MTSQSPLARSGIPFVAVKSTFSSPFWRANLGDKNAHSSTNNSHSHFFIVPSSSAPQIVAVKSTFSSPFWRENLGDKNTHSSQIRVTATFPLHHGHQRLVLHKICHFQPFVKLKLSKKVSWDPPFDKIPKRSHFSGLGNRRLRCVRSIVSGSKPLSLKCLIRTFIPSNFL